MKNNKKFLVNLLIWLSFSITIVLFSYAFAAKPGASTGGYVMGGIGPGGGIIFHLTDDGKKGLEAAPEDQGAGKWHNNEFITTNAAKSGINGGNFNTERIISNQGIGFYAALVAANYNGGGYGDWYLPSNDELNLMYKNLHLQSLGGFANGSYWSSTEHDGDNAWFQNYSFGSMDIEMKSTSFRIRPIRAF